MVKLIAQPLKLKHHTLKNRMIMGSMHTGFEDHPEGAEHLAAFYLERAKGGVSLIITGGISPNKEGAVFEGGAKLTEDSEVEWHKVVTQAVHSENTKICIQILHSGRYAMVNQPVAPSAIQTPINPAKPRALNTEEVKQTIVDYIHTAKLAQKAGYDGVEIMGSEGYLINEFLAPKTNKRNDEFGGSVENRQRFAVEIVSGIRKACGPEFLIIYRISLADLVEDGCTWEETQELARKIESAGADLFNTGIGWHEARIPTIATSVPRGAFIEFTAKLKLISKIPVIATNRINMPQVAEDILEKNIADAVCLARPFLADPFWVHKAINQEEHLINTCIACNQACLDHIFSGKLVSCLVNPFACHEQQLIMKPTLKAKNIAVVGAGPAGLSFSIAARQRGHDVTLFESKNEIGGQLNIAKKVPGKLEFHEMIRYFQNMIELLDIRLVLNKKVSISELIGFDEIVLATGIIPKKLDLSGSDRSNVLSYLDVLKEEIPVGEKVAIIGTGGIGFDTAEYLSHSGLDTALSVDGFINEWQIDRTLENRGALKSHPDLKPSLRTIYLLQRKEGSVGKNLGKTTGWIHRLVLKLKKVKMISGVEYQKIDDDGLHIVIAGEKQVLPVDQVVICIGQDPNDELHKECQKNNLSVHIIGGGKDARQVDAKKAISSGTQLALEI